MTNDKQSFAPLVPQDISVRRFVGTPHCSARTPDPSSNMATDNNLSPRSSNATNVYAQSPTAWPNNLPLESPLIMQQSATRLELVVPKDCECILVVPIHPRTQKPYNITDPEGNVVLIVERCEKADSRLVITTGHGYVLSQCCLVRMDSQKEFHFFDASKKHYATLTVDAVQQYASLSTMSGTRYSFWGCFGLHAVNITDHEQKLCASTEKCTVGFDCTGEYYHLRAGSFTDVGLIISSLICIEHFN